MTFTDSSQYGEASMFYAFAASLQQAWLHLRLQTSYNLLASLHDGVQFAGHHDGQALVFGQGQLDVRSCPLHDIQAHLGLLPLTKLAVVFVATLLQGHMEHLHSRYMTAGECVCAMEAHRAA